MSAQPLDRVHRRRLATQRLSSAGLASGADVVRLLGCVQSQDAPLAAWSLGMRMAPGTTYADVLAEQSAGGGCAPTCCAPPGTCSPPRTCAGCRA